jgi:Flp pilus assembly protein TadD
LVEAGRKCFSQSDHQTGASFLSEAIDRVGSNSFEMAQDLALVYKHQGRISEARRVLQNIAKPDAYTVLQLGLLSLEEKRLAQAEKEFARAWGEDPNSYQAGYNLFLTRLSLGEVEPALELLPRLLKLANKPEDREFLTLLNKALRSCPTQNGQMAENGSLSEVTPEEEQQILEFARNLGHPPTASRLLSALSADRPEDAMLRAAYLETVLLQAMQYLKRCDWNQAAQLLTPWVEAKDCASRPMQAALLNLLGCCACLSQDFEAGIHFFTSALQLVNRDARLSQNLALAKELQGRLSEAEPHWNWYLEMLDGRIPAPPDFPGYKERLAFECLHRLAVRFSDKGNATSALTFLQRAHQLRPEDTDTLERLFHVLNQLKRPEDARRALRRLRQLRPQEPQMEWFELELIDINNLDNCNRVLAGMEALTRKYPDDGRLTERQAQLVVAITSYMKRLSRQISEQTERAEARIRRLPAYQVDWPEMRRYLRELRSRLARIKKTAGRALPSAVNDPQRRNLQELIRQTEHEIDRCKTLV